MNIKRSGSSNGSGLSAMPRTTLYTVVVAPMPSASTTIAVVVKGRLLQSVRHA
jgi:hypothetical protein